MSRNTFVTPRKHVHVSGYDCECVFSTTVTLRFWPPEGASSVGKCQQYLIIHPMIDCNHGRCTTLDTNWLTGRERESLFADLWKT